MMNYFTILHWISLLVVLLLFVLFFVLTLRYQDKKSSLWPYVLTNVLITSLFILFSFYSIDKQFKVAKLINLVEKKVLLSESIVLSGQIVNSGKFSISKCTLELRVLNDSLGGVGSNAAGATFVPKSILDGLFKSEDIFAPKTVKEFILAEDFHPNEMRNFTVSIRYPPSFSRPYIRYDLSCH